MGRNLNIDLMGFFFFTNIVVDSVALNEWNEQKWKYVIQESVY